MLTIYKYEVPLGDTFNLKLPRGAEVIHFNSQNDIMQLWAKLDTDAELENRFFRLAGTGHNLLYMTQGYDLHYIGSAKLYDDALIFHLFELKPSGEPT